MKYWHTQPGSRLEGTLSVPPSKSHSLRAVFFASIARGTSKITNLLISPDKDAMVAACRKLGATIELLDDGQTAIIHGIGSIDSAFPDACTIDAGNSGIVLRLMGALAMFSKHPITITGDDSILNQRPIWPLVDTLRQLGAQVEYLQKKNHPPVRIIGPARNLVQNQAPIVIFGEDSQPVSGLLIALSLLNHPTNLHVKNAGELPWIQLTLDWLHRHGAAITHENYESFKVQGGWQSNGFEYTVPGDWSSATFPIIAALLTHSDISISGLDRHDSQGDKCIVDHLQQMGAHIVWDEVDSKLMVKGSDLASRLKGLFVDLNGCVDALPVMAVLGCYLQDVLELRNVAIAKTKESNRIAVICNELRKLGANIEELSDGIRVVGWGSLRGGVVDSCKDQRIAMALAIAGLGASAEVCVEDIVWAEKTYPRFAEELGSLGAFIKEEKKSNRLKKY